jgi:tetratricopeptide (TPR) repeat protein
MGYLLYYLLPFLLAYTTQHPGLAAFAVVFWLCRGFLPDPVLILRSFRRMSKLKSDIALNPANMVATRDLARMYIERKRPKKALVLLEQTRDRMAASTRHPLGSRDDAELLFLIGLGRLRSGDPAKALDALVAAVVIVPDLAYGDPFLAAAEALARLKRWEEAEDALLRFVETNHSSVAGWVKLARVRAKRDDGTGAKEAIASAKGTWAALPSYKRRHEWSWYVASLVSPLWLGIA